jgi:hypothetical protein
LAKQQQQRREGLAVRWRGSGAAVAEEFLFQLSRSSPARDQNSDFPKNFSGFWQVFRRKSFAVGCRVAIEVLQAVVVKTLPFVGPA